MPPPVSSRNSSWNLTKALHEKDQAEKKDGNFDPTNQVKAPWRPFLGVVFMFYSLGMWTESDVALAFLRSRVECDTPLPNLARLSEAGNDTTARGICPGGTYFEAGRCNPVGRWHRDWSASEHCPVKTIVVSKAVKIIGRTVSSSTIGAMFATIFMGATCIDSWGRKPMMLISYSSQFLQGVTFCVICMFNFSLDSGVTVGWLATGAVIAASFNTFSSAAGAMSVDGTVAESTERNNRIVGFSVARMLGVFGSVASSITLLSFKLPSYDNVWPAYCVALLIQVGISAMLLVETTPVERKEMTWEETFEHAANEIFATWEICTCDVKVIAGIVASGVAAGVFTASLSMSPSWTFLVLGIDQAHSAAAGLLGSLFSILGTTCSAGVMAMTSGLKCLVIAQTMMTSGLVVIAMGFYFPHHAQMLYWVGISALVSFGGGLAGPASFSLLTGRIAPENQGKFFSGIGLASMGMTAACVYIYTNVFLRSQGEELIKEMTIAWLVAAFASLLNMLFMVAVYGLNYSGTRAAQLTFRRGLSGTRLMVDLVDEAQSKRRR